MIGHGKPKEDGTYCVEVYFGWKIMDWRDGKWFHHLIDSPWTAMPPKQWVGPMPPPFKGFDL